MTETIAILVLLIIVAIIYLNRSGTISIKTREEFLNELAKFVEGKVSHLEEDQDSFKIDFNLDHYALTFEDLKLPGFKENINKAFLKLQLPLSLTLQFQEKQHSSKIFDQATGVFQIGQPSTIHVKMPEKLMEFQVYTDDAEFVKKLLINPKFVSILCEYTNRDRGYLFIPIKITQGLISLEFHKDPKYVPSLQTIRKNIHVFEDHIRDLITMAKIIQSVS